MITRNNIPTWNRDFVKSVPVYSITSARAFGSANETEHLPEMLDRNAKNLEEAGVLLEEGKKPTMSADANYFSEENLLACDERGIRRGDSGQSSIQARWSRWRKPL